MQKYLIIGANAIATSVAQRLMTMADATITVLHDPDEQLDPQVAQGVTDLADDLTQNAAYETVLAGQPVIFSALTGLDVDLAFEALFDVQYHQQAPLKRVVMLSTAGVDHEVQGTLTYPGITNVAEYLNQQRYAAKLVDEAEFPYTILRPVTLSDEPVQSAAIIPEGQPVPAGTVSRETVAQVAGDVILNGGYDYQSLAICAGK